MVRAAENVKVLVEGVNILEKIRKSKIRNSKIIKAVEEMKRVGVKVLWDKEWREEEKPLLKKRKVYVPKDKELRTEIIHLYHDTSVAGYGEQWKIVELVTWNFW